MKIALACDHGAFDFKESLTKKLQKEGHEVVDFGTTNKESCDYPDFGLKACEAVKEKKVERAILACTNGIGMSIVANKVSDVRAALVYSERTAEATRKHHGSNVLCLGAQEFSEKELFSFVDVWLKTEFEGGRHQRRVDKFPNV